MQKKLTKKQAPRGHRRDAGLTLVELAIAFATAAIVFFATGTIMVFGQRSLNRGWQQANLQREASLAMLKMKQSIRGATNATLDEDGNGVKIYHSAGWIRFWFVPGPKDLRYQLEGEQEQTLLDGVVEQADFAVDASKVTVDLALLEDDYEARLVTTTMMRNFTAGP
jgi:Tfp pilus assembly protein FimT